MSVVAGTSFTATLVDPGGLTSGVGARVEVPVTRAIVSYWRPAVLSGFLWSVTLDAPLDAGDFNLVWRDAFDPPGYEIFVPLFVVAAAASSAGGSDFPPVDTAAVRPTVDDVAALEQTRTRSEADGSEQGTFNDVTSPTATQVDGMIDQAELIVLAQLRGDFDTRHYPQVKQAIALLAAILIEGSFFRNQTEQTPGTTAVWRGLFNQMMMGLQAQIQIDLTQSYAPSSGSVLF